MFDFDSEVIEYCTKLRVAYSRYTDDLAFSTNEPKVLSGVYSYIEMLCKRNKSPKLTLNNEKTVFTSRKYHRQLTGLVLSNDGSISIGRDKQRFIRAMAHHYKMGTLAPEEHSKLRGWLAFTMSIDQKYVKTIEKLIGSDDFQRLMQN